MVLQRSSHTRGAGRADAGTEFGRGWRTSECQYVSLEAPLSWAVSDADRGMTACATPAPGPVSTSRGVDRLKRHARPRPRLKPGGDADLGSAESPLVRASFAARLAIRHRHVRACHKLSRRSSLLGCTSAALRTSWCTVETWGPNALQRARRLRRCSGRSTMEMSTCTSFVEVSSSPEGG